MFDGAGLRTPVEIEDSSKPEAVNPRGPSVNSSRGENFLLSLGNPVSIELGKELSNDMLETTSNCVFCKVDFKKSRQTSAGKVEIKILGCFHPACGHCLESRCKDGVRVQCPLCTPSVVGSGSVDPGYHDYVCNYAENERIDASAIEDDLDIACDECVDTCPAVKYCNECMKKLCKECSAHHERAKFTAFHELTLLREQKGKSQSMHRILYCPIHTDEPIEFFCETCDVMCCRECILRKHENHEYKLPAGNLADKQRQTMRDEVQRLRGLARSIHDRYQISAKTIKGVDEELEAARTSVDEVGSQIKAAIRERRQVLLNEIDTFKTRRQEVLEEQRAKITSKMVLMWQTIDFVERALLRGNAMEVLFLKSYVSHATMECAFDMDPQTCSDLIASTRISWRGLAMQDALDAIHNLQATFHGDSANLSTKSVAANKPRRRHFASASTPAVAAENEVPNASSFPSASPLSPLSPKPFANTHKYSSSSLADMDLASAEVPPLDLAQSGPRAQSKLEGQLPQPISQLVRYAASNPLCNPLTQHEAPATLQVQPSLQSLGQLSSGISAQNLALRVPDHIDQLDSSAIVSRETSDTLSMDVPEASAPSPTTCAAGPVEITTSRRRCRGGRRSKGKSSEAKLAKLVAAQTSGDLPILRLEAAFNAEQETRNQVAKPAGQPKQDLANPGLAPTNISLFDAIQAGSSLSSNAVFSAGYAMQQRAHHMDSIPKSISLFSAIEPQLQQELGVHDMSDEHLTSAFGNLRAVLGSQGDGRDCISAPCGIAVDSKFIYIADTLNHRIQVFDGKCHKHLGQISPYSRQIGALRDPSGLAIIGDRHLVIVEYDLDRMLQVRLDEDSFSIHSSVCTREALYGPFGCTHHNGKTFVADTCHHRIVAIDEAGKKLFEFGSRGIGPGQFEFPGCIAGFSDGNLAVSDKILNRIQVFDDSGTFLHYIPEDWEQDPDETSRLRPGMLYGPMGLCCDRRDRLYVCDCGSNRIQIFTRHGHWLWSSDRSRYMTNSTLLAPTGIAIDERGLVYIASDHRVQVF